MNGSNCLLPDYHGCMSEPNQQVVLSYLKLHYTLELIKRANPDQVSMVTAYNFGQFYMTPWRNDKDMVTEFYHRNNDDLTIFNIKNLIGLLKKTNENVQNFIQSKTAHKIPLDQNTIRSIRNVINSITKTEVNESEKCIMDTIDLSRRTMTYFQINALLHPQLQMLESIIRGHWETFMSLNKDNDNASKEHLGASRFEVLDNKIYDYIGCGIEKCCDYCTTKEGGMQILPTLVNLALITLHLYQPERLHLNSFERLYEKFVQTQDGYVRAVSEVRKYSGLYECDAINLMNNPLCVCKLKSDAEKVCSPELSIQPDSFVEKFLVLNELARC